MPREVHSVTPWARGLACVAAGGCISGGWQITTVASKSSPSCRVSAGSLVCVFELALASAQSGEFANGGTDGQQNWGIPSTPTRAGKPEAAPPGFDRAGGTRAPSGTAAWRCGGARCGRCRPSADPRPHPRLHPRLHLAAGGRRLGALHPRHAHRGARHRAAARRVPTDAQEAVARPADLAPAGDPR